MCGSMFNLMIFSIGQADFYQGMHKMHNHMHHIIVRMHNAMGYRKLSMFLLGGFRDERLHQDVAGENMVAK